MLHPKQRLAWFALVPFLVLALAGPAALSVAGCGDDATPTADAAAADAAADANPADAGVVLPDTPAGQRLAFVLAALNGAPVTAADATANFTAGFLAQVPLANLVAVFGQLAADAPWTLTGFDGTPSPSALVAIVTRGDGQYWRISLSTAPAEADKMDGLLLAPAGNLDPALASFDDIDVAIAALAPGVNLLAAQVDASACTPLHAFHPATSLAIGSAFKLYVLATLAESIGAGQRSWDDTIPIQDAHKSLPSGDLQDQPNGTLLPILTYAEKMISISDNTAADHLLFTLGRDAVETMLTTAQHHDPTQNTPFLGTRELFTLKLMLTPQQQLDYIAAPLAQKRTLLAQYDATLDPRTFVGNWVTPIHIDTMEWFATPADLCNVMRTLKNYGDQPATAQVYEVLGINPGLADLAHDFSYIGFKGGSEPGVLNLTWLVRRASDDQWRFLSLGFNNPSTDVPVDRILYIAGAARALLAQ